MTTESEAPVIVEARDGAMYVTLNRPEKLNAQNTPMRRALIDTYDRFDADDELLVLVLRAPVELSRRVPTCASSRRRSRTARRLRPGANSGWSTSRDSSVSASR